MKTIALTVIVALASPLLSNALRAQTQVPTRDSAAEVRQAAAAEDPAKQEMQRTAEETASTTIVKETKPTVWDSAAGKQFMTAIESRKGRWADFDQIVFQSKVVYSEDMLSLMAKSPYAADIAYYLGMHPHDSAAYAAMPIEQSAPAIRAIEDKAKSDGVKAVVEPVRP